MSEPKKLGRPLLTLSREGRISRERIRQIQERALGKLRRAMYAKGYKFEDFFDDSKKKG